MNYLTSEEIKKGKEKIKNKYEILQGRRLLALKGKNIDIFFKNIKNLNANVLDISTGSGAFLKAICDLGYKNLYGCDLDDYVSENIKHLIKDFNTLDLSFNQMPWEDNSFDIVTAWEVFEHFENPHNAIREIHRVLKPSGLLLFSVPNIFHIVSRLVFLRRGLFPRWNETNNHISVFPHGIFEKAFLRYFDFISDGYIHAKISLPFLNQIKWLPENK
ncbi:MAG: class I SAM-dependent methyltransferase [Patescibacteria group bacterium]